MEHKGTVELQTNRLILRRFSFEDVNFMFKNWSSNKNVTRYMAWQAHTDIQVTQSVILEWVKRYEDLNFYQWAIEMKEIAEPIGSISVVRTNEATDECEIGYCIGEKWWHRGITSEAVQTVINFLFDSVKAKCVSAKHDTNNPYSGKVMTKCGMEYRGVLRKVRKNSAGEVYDLAVYSKLNY